MSKLRKLFVVTPKDLSMQKFSSVDIANRMTKTDELSMRLPRSFARTVTRILEHDRSTDANNAKTSSSKRDRSDR